VSGTQQAVDHAGRDDEMAYQEMLKGLELKRDMETIILIGSRTRRRSRATRPRPARPARCCRGSRPTPAARDRLQSGHFGRHQLAHGRHAARAFTEALLKTVLSAIWTQGGKPDTVMVNSFNKQQFSTFTGRASPIEDTKAKKITASVDAYESDFGTLKVVRTASSVS
jgi:hypothetical protein